jgi:hypothetical protein
MDRSFGGAAVTGRPRAYFAALVVTVTLGMTCSAGLAAAEPETPETSTTVAVPPSTQPSAPTEPSAPPSVSSPQVAARQAQHPLDVTATFDKAAYRTGELVNVELTIKNVGDKVIPDVIGFQNPPGSTSLEPLEYDQWERAGLRGYGASIEPGATYTAKLYGYPFSAEADTVLFEGDVSSISLGLSATFSISAPVTKVYGDAGGIVFADRNGNGQADAGEGLPDIPIAFGYVSNVEEQYTTKSGPGGVFAFSDIPAATYRTAFQGKAGWLLLATTVAVPEAGIQDVRIRGVQPLQDVLTPEVKFTKDSYQPGDLAHVTVTLRNRGDIPLTGIVATCNGYEEPDSIYSGPGWGDLAPQAKGVTVSAKQTRTFDVTATVPHVSRRTGVVVVSCHFAYIGYDNKLDLQSVKDTAVVPGGRGGILATVSNDPDGDPVDPDLPPVPGVKVVLVDDRSCNLGSKITDAKGNAEFTDLVAGPAKYSLYFYPPAGWMMKSENPTGRQNVIADELAPLVVAAAPGDGQVPVLPAPSPECGQDQPLKGTQPTQPPATQPPPGDRPDAPAPQGKAVKLANTGVNVLGLGVTGMAFLLLGTGVIVATRRPRLPRHTPDR